ncbi:MAG: zinc-ribbon domain-containing protein [Ramlibacter sp.]|nr:zinc-ribbon domain-containing protein [Ramlibacter sp.]
MKLFNCDNCGSALFFENVICLHCRSSLAFLPDRMELAAIEPAPQADDLWRQLTSPRMRHWNRLTPAIARPPPSA